MTYPWSKSVIPIALIFSFRMLGLFMLIPVFSVLGKQLNDATPALIGIALGAYGLSQGLLQMPFGLLSDHYGRKPIITIGLILFAAGSLLGALTHSIYGMIIARILQGTGAIGSVLIALLADVTSEKQRTKAMAIIGVTIGISFSLAMVLSPIITHYYGLAGIFYLTFILAATGLFLLLRLIPTPAKEQLPTNKTAYLSLLKQVLKDKDLHRLNAGIFMQHAILTSSFYVIPLLLHAHILEGRLNAAWHFYLPILIGSFLAMIPFIFIAERYQKMRWIFLGAVATILVSESLLALWATHFYILCLVIFIYFIAFNILEAALPSLISKQANQNSKGTAMGVYSTCQFLGIFAGGTLAGIVFQYWSAQGVFIFNALLSLIWLFTSYSIKVKKNHIDQ